VGTNVHSLLKTTRIATHRYSQHGDNSISSCPADCVLLVYKLCRKTLQTEDRDVATVVIMLPYGVIARERPTPHKPQVLLTYLLHGAESFLRS
jgi:hypothetical protein